MSTRSSSLGLAADPVSNLTSQQVLAGILDQYLLGMKVCTLLTVKDIQNLQLTCKDLRKVVRWYGRKVQTAFISEKSTKDCNKRLKKFLQDLEDTNKTTDHPWIFLPAVDFRFKNSVWNFQNPVFNHPVQLIKNNGDNLVRLEIRDCKFEDAVNKYEPVFHILSKCTSLKHLAMINPQFNPPKRGMEPPSSEYSTGTVVISHQLEGFFFTGLSYDLGIEKKPVCLNHNEGRSIRLSMPNIKSLGLDHTTINILEYSGVHIFQHLQSLKYQQSFGYSNTAPVHLLYTFVTKSRPPLLSSLSLTGLFIDRLSKPSKYEIILSACANSIQHVLLDTAFQPNIIMAPEHAYVSEICSKTSFLQLKTLRIKYQEFINGRNSMTKFDFGILENTPNLEQLSFTSYGYSWDRSCSILTPEQMGSVKRSGGDFNYFNLPRLEELSFDYEGSVQPYQFNEEAVDLISTWAPNLKMIRLVLSDATLQILLDRLPELKEVIISSTSPVSVRTIKKLAGKYPNVLIKAPYLEIEEGDEDWGVIRTFTRAVSKEVKEEINCNMKPSSSSSSYAVTSSHPNLSNLPSSSSSPSLSPSSSPSSSATSSPPPSPPPIIQPRPSASLKSSSILFNVRVLIPFRVLQKITEKPFLHHNNLQKLAGSGGYSHGHYNDNAYSTPGSFERPYDFRNIKEIACLRKCLQYIYDLTDAHGTIQIVLFREWVEELISNPSFIQKIRERGLEIEHRIIRRHAVRLNNMASSELRDNYRHIDQSTGTVSQETICTIRGDVDRTIDYVCQLTKAISKRSLPGTVPFFRAFTELEFLKFYILPNLEEQLQDLPPTK